MPSLIAENEQWMDSNGKPIVSGKLYIGSRNNDPKLNPITIYSDRALTVVLANPQTLDADGRSTNKIWVPGRYSIKIEDVNGTQKYQNLDAGEETGITATALVNVTGANTITADGNTTVVAYSDKAQYVFTVATENTVDVVTVAIDGLAAKTIKRNLDQDVGKGKFKVNSLIIIQYNLAADVMEWVNENARVIFDTNGADIVSAATVDLSVATGNNIIVTGHDGPITSFGTVIAGPIFNLTFPGSAAVAITSSSVASPTNILCGAVHGLTNGDQVFIEGHTGSVPVINGRYPITFVDNLNYTIPVNVTTGGTGGTSTGVAKITNNATSMILAGGVDLIPEPGSVLTMQSLGSGNHKQINRLPAIANQTQAEAQTNLSIFEVLSVLGGWQQTSKILSSLIDVVTATDASHPVPTWANNALALAIGGGGSGNNHLSNGAGGAGAGGIIALVPVTAGGTLDIQIGAGGITPTFNLSGNPGSNTTIDSTLVVAEGGGSGVGGTPAVGGGGSTTGTLFALSKGINGDLIARNGGAGGLLSAPGGVEIIGATSEDGTGIGAGGGGSAGAFLGGDGIDGGVLIIWLG